MSDLSDLQCPECGSRALLLPWSAPGKVQCSDCNIIGTRAYFTPQVPERDEADAKIISRTFDVALDRPDGQHVASVNSAMMLLTRAATEEDLELDWGTLRLVTTADGSVITYLAVIKAYSKPPVPQHDLGGVAVTTSDGKAKVIRPAVPGPPEVQPNWSKAYKNGDRRGMEMVGYASMPASTIVRPDRADTELARRSRLE